MRTIAIITGASSGLGREFVHQVDCGAVEGLDEIWAVGRRAERLDALVRTVQTTVRPFCLDLSDDSSFDILAAALAEAGDIRVRLLVNCAGFGSFGDFALQARESASQMMGILMRAPVEVTYRVLPYLGAGSRIVNVSSVAAFAPQPRLAVYAASKRFVLDFSRALDAELAPVDIHVTALCPKFMKTEFLSHAGDDAAARAMTAIGFEQPADVARAALRASNAGRALCIPSPDMRAYYLASKLLPYPVLLKAEKALGIL